MVQERGKKPWENPVSRQKALLKTVTQGSKEPISKTTFYKQKALHRLSRKDIKPDEQNQKIDSLV